MRINRCFEYPVLKRITRPDGVRHYVCPETGALLPSATTILGETADKSFLVEWRARVGDEAAERIKKEATDLGSLMHLHIENHVMGIERPGGTNLIRKMAKKMADQIITKGLPNVDEVWGQEVALYHPWLFAGTTDLVGVYKGQQAIMDHKTAKKLRTRAQITDYFDQISAYAFAHDEKYGTKIKTGVIFMVSREYEYREFVLNFDDLQRHQSSFFDRLAIFANKHGDPKIPNVPLDELVTA